MRSRQSMGWWCVLALALGLSAALPAAAQEGTPAPKAATAVVEKLHDALLGVMREADKLGYAGRRDRLSPVIRQVYDLPLVTEVAVGRHWRDLDKAQRQKIIELFSRFTIATYASRFDGYSGETFETESTRSLGSNRALVRSAIKSPDGDSTQLDYILQSRDGQWRIINVIADGVSDLSLKRAEFSSIIQKKGFDALVADLQSKIDNYAKTGAKAGKS